MAEGYDISVIISTHNRSSMLFEALASVLSQADQGASVRYQVIVVDNNSTDRTREVVEHYIAQGHANLKYVFEGRQGVSYARNSGVENALAPIIAFTDDDVRVSENWVASIKAGFDSHPEVDFLGGKILPRWKTAPPAWLNRDHWWALALLDYGDKAFYVGADNPLCLPTANASFRRDLFERFGRFSPEFSGREDHEFLLRLWCEGVCGMYYPDVVVTAEVQPERLRRGYHRRWNTTTGRFNSVMRLNEVMGPDGRIVTEAPDAVTLFGVPAFIYRNLLSGGIGLVSSTLLGRQAASLRHRNGLWYLIGYIHKRFEQNASHRDHSGISEIGAFVRALLRKKLNGNRQTPEHQNTPPMPEQRGTGRRAAAPERSAMSEHYAVSAIISTYNRSDMLRAALDSVLNQENRGIRYEVIVVDNNSTDSTREVVESCIAEGHPNVRYVFEPRQGSSYARNAGLALARSEIIAFADDDVRVAPNWIATIKRAFDDHPGVDCVGGKVLPLWSTPAPNWLTSDHWMPLALLDYGDSLLSISQRNRLCLVSANLAFRRRAFVEIGLFAPELQRIKNGIGSMEDAELLERFWGTGRQCLYLPGLIVETDVGAERLTKEYHRRWHRGHGHFYAIRRSDEIDRGNSRLFDVPAHLYKQAVIDLASWLSLLFGNRSRAFVHETRLHFFCGFFRKRRKDYLASAHRGFISEIVNFVRSLAAKKQYSEGTKQCG